MPADEPLGRVFALFCLRRVSCFACGTTIAGSKIVDHAAGRRAATKKGNAKKDQGWTLLS
jgi:hypothetical protein